VLDEITNFVIGASLLVPCPAHDLYDAMLDVRNFPRWAPEVRRVEVLERYGEPSMVSEWEICFLGLKIKLLSVLEEAESPALLRWTYDGLVGGWGQCVIREHGERALAVFQTELWATEPCLKKLMRMRPARQAASTYLRSCLAQLGRMVSRDGSQVRVGPTEGIEL
jgi:Polyketide cyclase / dehydrase and lipid transport